MSLFLEYFFYLKHLIGKGHTSADEDFHNVNLEIKLLFLIIV